jgi:flagellar basal-body rod protein FlgB
MIKGMFDNGALPVLERLVQFTGARHKVLAHNVANISTPYFKPRDLDPASFQQSLADAIDARRRTMAPTAGPLEVQDTRDVSFREGGLNIKPQATNDNILFHDQNNRDVERLMQRLAENTMTHNTAIEMVRSEFNIMRVAISERV